MMKNGLVSCICALIALCIQAQDINISKVYVADQLSALSSDELKGRKVFSEEIEEAAKIIANEFKASELSYLPGLDSYMQEFNMFIIRTASNSIKIGDTEISSNDVFGLFDSERIEWDQDSKVNVVSVSSDDRFPEAFSDARRSGEDALVLVDKKHKKIFSSYQSYFSKGSTKFKVGEGANIIFVLTDTPDAKKYSVDIQNNVEEKKLANVAGMIEGNRADEIVLFSAHYDHIGIMKPAKGDSIANGANDDASGTTAVMALANYFKSQPKPERSIYFVAFTAEEVGGFGSQYFSNQLNPDQIVAMFNIEMIGKPAVEGPNSAWITGFERSSFGELLQKSVEGTKYKFYPDPYPAQNLFYRSDNATLARLGVPAHSISTTPIDVDKDYHQVSDEFETIDVEHMTNTIKAIAQAAVGIVSGKDTPTRVDTSKVD